MIIIAFLIGAALGYWAYTDAEKRKGNKILAFCLGFFLGLVGLLIWWLVRPKVKKNVKVRKNA